MAKILIVTENGIGNWFSLRFEEEKHDCDIYYVGDLKKPDRYALDGLIRPLMTKKPDFGKYDLVLFDSTIKQVELAEESLKVTGTIGNGEFNKQAEDDRLFGLQIMEEAGINVPAWEAFDDVNDAKRFVRKTNKSYVFKPYGGEDEDTASTYVGKSPDDLLRYLDKLSSTAKGTKFILQEVVTGTEISTEGWFNGEDFFLTNSTLEEKKFMDGAHGPNTGCSGNVVFVHDNLNSPLIFREGLFKMKDFLRQVGYRGMIDLNTIVSDREMFGLEWTPRFGYDATATLFNLIRSDLADFIGSVASGVIPHYEIKNQFAAGIRLSIPPYPTEIPGHHPGDVPIQGLDPDKDDIAKDYFLYDCALDGDELVTVGITGMIMVVLTNGQTVPEVFDSCYERIKKIQIPNMQYRGDLLNCCNKRFNTLRSQGWLR